MSDDIPAIEDGVSYDEETGRYLASYDRSTTDPGMAVVTAMSVICDTEPIQLAPLNDFIDVMALDELLSQAATDPTSADPSVEFTYLDYTVQIDSYGLLEIRPPAGDEDRTG